MRLGACGGAAPGRAAGEPVAAQEPPHERGRARARRIAVRAGATARPGVAQPLDQPQLQHDPATPAVPLGRAHARVANGHGGAQGAAAVVGEPLRGDPGAVGGCDDPVGHPLHDHGGRQRRRPGRGVGHDAASRHRPEGARRTGRRPVGRRRMHPDAREEVRVAGPEDQCHRAARGQPGHVDPPGVDPPAGLLVEHGRRHARQHRGLAAAPLLVAPVIPAPTAVGVVAEDLLGRDEHDAVPVRDRREPRRVDELLGLLVAAVQQHQQRRPATAAVPGGQVHRAQPTAQGRARHPLPRRPAPDEGGNPRRPALDRHNTRSWHAARPGRRGSTGWKGRAAVVRGYQARGRAEGRRAPMSGSVRSATAEHPSGSSGLRTALATVCISGTLEDKLAAAAAAGFDGVEIFEPDLVASALVARRDPGPLRRAGPLHRPLPALPRPRLHRPRAVRAQPAPRRAQVRAHGRAGHRPHPGLLRGRPRRRRRPGPPRRPAARPRRTGRAHGMRVAYEALAWGTRDLDLRAVLGRRAPGRPPRARPVPRQLPHPVPRLGPRGHRGHPRREAVLPPARRRPAHEHGRAAVEPPPPALPRPGRVGPARLPRPRAGRRLHRAAVARGVQRRLPPVRPAPRRRRRPPFAAGAARGDRAAPGRVRERRAPAAHPGAARVRVHRAGRRRRRPARPSRGCSPRSASPTTGGTAASRCSCGSRATPSVLLNESGDRTGAAVAALGIETADPAAAAGRAPGAARAAAAAAPRARGGRPARRHRAGRHRGVLLPHRHRGRELAGRLRADRRPRAGTGAVTHVDHVALTQPYDNFDEAALFYRVAARPAPPSTRRRSRPRSAWCATAPSATAA